MSHGITKVAEFFAYETWDLPKINFTSFLRLGIGVYFLDDSSHLMWGCVEHELPDGRDPSTLHEAFFMVAMTPICDVSVLTEMTEENAAKLSMAAIASICDVMKALCDVSDLSEETPENIAKLIAWLRSHDEDVLCADVKWLSKKGAS